MHGSPRRCPAGNAAFGVLFFVQGAARRADAGCGEVVAQSSKHEYPRRWFRNSEVSIGAGYRCGDQAARLRARSPGQANGPSRGTGSHGRPSWRERRGAWCP